MAEIFFDKKKFFQCVICKGIFEKILTEEELVKQFNKEFPDFDIEDTGVVCEDCFQKHSKNWGVKGE